MLQRRSVIAEPAQHVNSFIHCPLDTAIPGCNAPHPNSPAMDRLTPEQALESLERLVAEGSDDPGELQKVQVVCCSVLVYILKLSDLCSCRSLASRAARDRGAFQVTPRVSMESRSCQNKGKPKTKQQIQKRL